MANAKVALPLGVLLCFVCFLPGGLLWAGPKDGEPSTYRFAATQPLPREGYPGLVDAEIALARQLAGAIAESLGN